MNEERYDNTHPVYENKFDEILTGVRKSHGIAYLKGDDKRLLARSVREAYHAGLEKAVEIVYQHCGMIDDFGSTITETIIAAIKKEMK